jgi:pimeloyl-ACP methyl ester carboxylesterase
MMIDLPGVSLFYQQSGIGSPLLLLHGNGEDHTIFEPLSKKLEGHFSVYAIDSRNHGRSQTTAEYKYDVMAQDVYNFIVKLGIGRVGIIGFSDGAILALILALNHPEVIDRMALLGPNLEPDDIKPEFIAWIKEKLAETGNRLWSMILQEPHLDLEALAKVDIPTLVMGGENDIFKPETFSTLAKTLKNAALKIVPGHDHESYIAGSDLVFPDLMEFFANRG